MNHNVIIVEQVNLLINDVYLETIFPKKKINPNFSRSKSDHLLFVETVVIRQLIQVIVE